ncbi:hypothetical protein Tco_1415659, partial [Tanacetum coccineum]
MNRNDVRHRFMLCCSGNWKGGRVRASLASAKCYAIVEAIDFDTGFASFVLGDNSILSSMPPISSLPPLMVCGVGDRLVASLSL